MSAEDTAETPIFAIADLHLNHSNPIELSDFGDHWLQHMPVLAERWDATVPDNALVLVPGDISWASRATAAVDDLQWIADRPGRKILSTGNHDRWWRSAAYMPSILPSNCQSVHRNWMPLGRGVVGAFRGHTCPGDVFFRSERDERKWLVALREMSQLCHDLRKIRSKREVEFAILMVHYPPYNGYGEPSDLIDMIDEFKIDLCVSGHFHRNEEWINTWNGSRENCSYAFVAADSRDFRPIQVATLADGHLLPAPIPIPRGPKPRPAKKAVAITPDRATLDRAAADGPAADGPAVDGLTQATTATFESIPGQSSPDPSTSGA